MMNDEWIEVRDRSGKLMFKYNPRNNVIEIKRGGFVYSVVKLDEIRIKYGFIEDVGQSTLGIEVAEDL